MSSKRRRSTNDGADVPSSKRKGVEVFDVIDLSGDEEEAAVSRRGILDICAVEPAFVERILAEISVIDLLLVVNRVCRRFHQIIGNPKFLPFSKLYHGYLRGVSQFQNQVTLLIKEAQLTGIDTCIFRTIEFLAKTFSGRKSLGPNAARELKKSSLFNVIEKLPIIEAIDDYGARISAIFASTLIFTNSACDIFTLVGKLLQSVGGEERKRVIECMYLAATFLLRCHQTYNVSPRFHYNILSAIYMLENRGGKGYVSLGGKGQNRGKSGQLSMHAFLDPQQCSGGRQLTFEQYRIVNYDLTPTDCVRIIAYAGTGKTTTLKEYVRNRPDKKFLVLMYNRSICEEAKKSFPKNATCLTTHQWAIRSPFLDDPFTEGSKRTVNDAYKGKLWNRGLRVTHVVGALKDTAASGMDLYVRAKQALKTVQNFCASTEQEISEEVTPDFELNGQGQENTLKLISPKNRQQIAEDAKYLWKKMVDPENYSVGMTHDAYLKLFQLHCPIDTRFAMILIDEAQDMNPATLDVVLKQKVPKIFVGDPNQQIYAFRGAVDALEIIKDQATRTFFLTQSFRFGPEIGFLANSWLEKTKLEHKKPIIGIQKEAFLDGTLLKPVCIITRYNATLFDECLKICSRGKYLMILGGHQKFGLDDVIDIYWISLAPEDRVRLKLEPPNPNSFIGKFTSLDKLKRYANKTFDRDLVAKIAMVEKYGELIPGHVKRIKAFHDKKKAEYILTTAHMAKGMEFECVRMGSDFETLDILREEAMLSKTKLQGDQAVNEFNLIYVAMTRAKKSLIVNSCLFNLLWSEVHEPLEYLMPSADIAKNNAQCQNCDADANNLPPDTFVLCRKKIGIVISTGSRNDCWIRPGFLCPSCATSRRAPRFLLDSAHSNHPVPPLILVPHLQELLEATIRPDYTRLSLKQVLSLQSMPSSA